MPNSRRKFIQQTTLVALGSIGIPAYLKAAKKPLSITGVQLYSVRADMKNDPVATLKALSEMGYKYVEHANYINRKFYGYTAKEFKKLLDELGLKMPSGHTVLKPEHWDLNKKDFSDSWKYTIEDAAIAGQSLVISPWLDEGLRKTKDSILYYMEVYNKCGLLCQKSGMSFGYHNHNFEFSEKLAGELIYDIILKNTDPSLVKQQLDMGNLFETGVDGLAVLKANLDRIISMHVKDIIKKENGIGYESALLGKGLQKVKAIIDEGKKANTIHFIVEQEDYQGMPPLDCMKENLTMMKNWGY